MREANIKEIQNTANNKVFTRIKVLPTVFNMTAMLQRMKKHNVVDDNLK